MSTKKKAKMMMDASSKVILCLHLDYDVFDV